MAALKLKEADVTRQAVGFLEAHGFTVIRMNSGLFQRPGGKSRIRIGASGDPDYLVVKAPRLSTRLSPWMWGFYLEIKRPGGKLSPTQITKHEELRSKGFEVLVIDNLDLLIDWVKGTGYI